MGESLLLFVETAYDGLPERMLDEKTDAPKNVRCWCDRTYKPSSVEYGNLSRLYVAAQL